MDFVLCPLEDKQNQKLILPTPVSHTALIPGHHHGHWSEMRYSTITEVPDETDLSFKVQLLQIHIEAVHNSPVTCSWYIAETDTCNVSCFRYIVFGFYTGFGATAQINILQYQRTFVGNKIRGRFYLWNRPG